MTENNTPKSFIEWLGFTANPDFSKARLLGASIGAVVVVTVTGAIILSIIQFFIAASGFSNSQTIHADARNYALILAALLSIPFVIWRVLIAQKQANIAEQGLITDRITKAVEQLGAEKTIWVDGDQQSVPNLEVRLGGIYALSRVARDSPRDHISIMEILCAYVRQNAPAESAEKIQVDYNNENWAAFQALRIMKIPAPRIDIQAALTLIGDRSNSQIKYERSAAANSIKREYRLDLRNTNLQKIDLHKLNFDNALFLNTKMHGANLIGVEMRNADLKYSEMLGVDLGFSEIQGADLSYTKLSDSNFISANTNLTAIYFTGLDRVKNLNEDQLHSMFGCSLSPIPEGMKNPVWSNWKPIRSEFYNAWKAAKSAANL